MNRRAPRLSPADSQLVAKLARFKVAQATAAEATGEAEQEAALDAMLQTAEDADGLAPLCVTAAGAAAALEWARIEVVGDFPVKDRVLGFLDLGLRVLRSTVEREGAHG